MFDISFDLETWLVICSAIGAGFVFYLTATALSDGLGGRRLRRRLNAVRDRAQGIPAPATTAERSLSRQRNATTIDRIARRWLPRRDILASRLARTGYAITVGQYALVMIGLAVVAAIGLIAATSIGLIPSLLVAVLIGTALPHKIVSRMGRRRVAAFIKLFPEAIDLMVRALRSGLPISEAIIGAGREIAGPVGAELGRIEAGMRLGRDLDTLLWDIAARIDVPEFRFLHHRPQRSTRDWRQSCRDPRQSC